MKKLLASLFMLLLLAGCGNSSRKSEEPTNNTPTTSLNNEMLESTFSSDSIELPQLPEIENNYPDKEIITIVYNSSIAKISKRVNDEINKKIVESGEEYVLFFEYIDEELYSETINERIKSGNAPDIVCAGIGEYGTLQGTRRAFVYDWFEPLDDYLATDEGQTLWRAVPERLWKACVVNNTYYGVCAMLPYVSSCVYVVNKDLMDQYDIKESDIKGKKLTELSEVFEKIDNKDIKLIDVNTFSGFDKSQILGVIDVVDNTGHQNPALSFKLDAEDDDAINLFSDAQMIEQFKILAEYEKKNYFLGSKDVFLAMDYQNEFNLADDRINSIVKRCGFKNYVLIEEAPCEIFGYWNNLTGICKASTNKEKARKALTLLMSDEEITTLVLYGIEGEDYKLKDGLIDITHSTKSMYYGNPFISKRTLYEPESKWEVYNSLLERMYITPNVGIYYDLTDYVDNMKEIESICKEYQGLFMGNYENVDEVIAQINVKLENAGIKEIVEEINSQKEAQRSSK